MSIQHTYAPTEASKRIDELEGQVKEQRNTIISQWDRLCQQARATGERDEARRQSADRRDDIHRLREKLQTANELAAGYKRRLSELGASVEVMQKETAVLTKRVTAHNARVAATERILRGVKAVCDGDVGSFGALETLWKEFVDMGERS